MARRRGATGSFSSPFASSTLLGLDAAEPAEACEITEAGALIDDVKAESRSSSSSSNKRSSVLNEVLLKFLGFLVSFVGNL